MGDVLDFLQKDGVNCLPEVHQNLSKRMGDADLRRQPTPKEVAKTVQDTDTITAAHERITLPTEVPETKPRRRLPTPAARRGGPQKPAPEATSEEPQESDDLATLLATFEKQNSF